MRFGELYKTPSCNGLSRPRAVRGEGYKMVNMGELFSNNIINDIYMERVQMNERELKKFLLKKGDLLFARQSLVASGAGKCSIVNNIVEDTTFESHLIRVRLDESKANPLYYYYLFQLPYNPVKTIVNQCAQAGIRGTELIRVKVPFPTMKEQNRIANALFQYDNLIENNNKRIKLLEQMAENLYKEWFVRFRFPGYEDVEFEEKKPRGWQVGTETKKHFAPTIFKYDEFRNIGSFVRGKNITAVKMVEGDIPVISAGLQPAGYHNQANVFGANITISASGANAGYLQYHMIDIWAADCSYYQDDATIWFVYNTLKYLQPVISNLQCGAAQPHVYPKNINRLCVLIPTKELMYKYNGFVKAYYDEIKILNQHNQLLTKQRDLLLPRLMSGKLEV